MDGHRSPFAPFALFALFADSVTPETVRSALEATDAPASARRLDYRHTEERGDRTVHVWEDDASGTRLELVEDDALRCSYAVIDARAPDASDIRDYLHGTLDVISGASLRETLGRDLASSPQRLVHLAVCGRDDLAASEAIVKEALRHADPTVRRAAAVATAMLRTPALIDEADVRVAVERDEPTAALLTGALRSVDRV